MKHKPHSAGTRHRSECHFTNPRPDLLYMGEIREFIRASKWIFAKTMRKTPHEYTLRKDARAGGREETFERFVLHIRKHGYSGKFGKTTYKYFDVDGWQYWTMGCPLYVPPPNEDRGTILINRALLPGQPGTQRKMFGE
jgi:hypothetical protein